MVRFSGKNVWVIGLGIVGESMCRYLHRQGANVLVNDHRALNALKCATELEALGVTLELGAHPERLPSHVDFVFVSPGVPALPMLDHARAEGIPVAGELALIAPELSGTVVAITGTNGKSTVTSLVGEMCGNSDRPVFVGGNLGRPMLEAVGTPAAQAGGIVVLELSSFQLEHIDAFRPDVAAILNISDDHLDRYDDMQHYAETKAALVQNQTERDVLVLPADEALAAPILATEGVARARCRIARFAGIDGQVRVTDGTLQNGQSGLHVEVASLPIQGKHNFDNACAATLLSRTIGIKVADIERALCSYAGLPHRMRLVEVVDGVRYVNDSKATNVGAAVAALRGAGLEGDARVILIAGGRDKGGSYEPLREAAAKMARGVVVLGEASDRIRAALEPAVPVTDATDLGDAVVRASAMAKTGDLVLLAPACSSYDMFRSYIQRGEAFEAAVRHLQQRKQGA